MKKCFLFNQKSSFCSQVNQVFFYFRPSIFYSLSALLQRMINLKVYDTIMCLNKNSIKIFCLISWEGKKVWHWNFVRRWSIKKGTFLYAENMQQKLVPDIFIILVNNPKQPLHARNFFKVRFFERRLSKSHKKGNFIFSFEPSPFL